MAQLVEHVPCKHKVGGSIPPGGFIVCRVCVVTVNTLIR
jgi:hypothetical protein